MKRLDELFFVKYGNSLDLASMHQVEKSGKHAINYISRTARNNGLSAFVEVIAGEMPQSAGTISVAVSGSVMEAFLQTEAYYTGFHMMILSPKVPMTDLQKLYYCSCIRANKYRYNYGRQANKTLSGILVPDISDIPEWVTSSQIPSFDDIDNTLKKEMVPLNTSTWKLFRYDKLFSIKKGKRITKLDMIPGSTPFLGAIDSNNGVREYAGLVAPHQGNTITVNYNGSVGEAFYQEQPFWASDDINVLYPKFVMNKYIAMFLIAIIRCDKYRFNYGRKWHKERMEASTIRLPVDTDGNPDWAYMERFIKSLPYSASI